MNLHTNPQLELAYQYICHTNKHLFLTGKAGSGKTTFLHKIRENRIKRMAIVAPTGVAAINAGGMTIHSLFQIAIGLHLPGVERRQPAGRFRAEKIRLIRSLDLLVIDEVSMVRADLLDAIDEVLKRLRQSTKPFGGVQLLMIGDLHQLPPVVKPEDWNILKNHYETPYFFGSHALRKTDYISIELKHIYRQSDTEFIALLNQVRDSRLDSASLQKLNSRFIPNFKPPADLPYITLTATNAAASEINNESLRKLPSRIKNFQALITGDFPPSNFPTEENLELKVGAQVMFIRNDTSDQRLFFNGKLGSIAHMEDDLITIHSPGENQAIVVEPVEWENIKYSFNEQTKAIEEQVIGTFTQFPVRHAWAITIHKSQGLTFDRCIIDAQAAFASGQVYVALSRCKSFEGIVLRTPIVQHSVKTDPVIKEFSAEAERNVPTETQLRAAKYECQASALQTLFEFDDIFESIQKLAGLCLQFSQSLSGEIYKDYLRLQESLQLEIRDVCRKFAPQLSAYLQSPELPELNETLQNRLRKASVYFVDKISTVISQVQQILVETDNKEVAKQFASCHENLLKMLQIKKFCFAVCNDGFSAERINKARCDAELDFLKTEKNRERNRAIPKDVPHPDLYELLSEWRKEMAMRESLPEFDVVPNLTLKDISTSLPTTKKQLSLIRGIGKTRLKKYCEPILQIILAYCQEKQLHNTPSPTISVTEEPQPLKPHTKQISLEMYRSGKSVEEIALERGFAKTTILGHLSHFVELGELDVALFLDETSFGEIVKYLNDNPEATLSTMKEHFGDKYDYGSLRMAVAALVHLDDKRTPPQKE